MGKLESFDGKQTNLEGLWFHPEFNGYMSASINLTALKQFKGAIRVYVFKNKQYTKGSKRPEYLFTIKDSKSEETSTVSIKENVTYGKSYYKDGKYYKHNGERLYTQEEVNDLVYDAEWDTREELEEEMKKKIMWETDKYCW